MNDKLHTQHNSCCFFLMWTSY